MNGNIVVVFKWIERWFELVVKVTVDRTSLLVEIPSFESACVTSWHFFVTSVTLTVQLPPEILELWSLGTCEVCEVPRFTRLFDNGYVWFFHSNKSSDFRCRYRYQREHLPIFETHYEHWWPDLYEKLWSFPLNRITKLTPITSQSSTSPVSTCY